MEVKKKAVIISDKFGKPNFMTMFYLNKEDHAKAKLEDVPEMFRVNEKVVAAVLISQFTNKVIGGVPYSLPFQMPEERVSHEKAMQLCREKGDGWHLMTNTEFMYLLEDAEKCGHEICGNTEHGKDADHQEQQGWCYDGYTTLTGADPVEWSHDGTQGGVYGLKGNFWEHVTGLMLEKGKIKYIPDNNAAAVEDDTMPEHYKTVKLNGETVVMESRDGVTLKTGSAKVGWGDCHYRELKVELPGGEVPEILHKLGVVPKNWKEEKAGLFVDSGIDAVPCRGSSFNDTSSGGVGALILYYPRTFSSNSISFRSALYLENWELVTELL